jgi:hypothetical protein
MHWVTETLVLAGSANTAIWFPDVSTRAFIHKYSSFIEDSWDALAVTFAGIYIPFVIFRTHLRVAQAFA